MTDFEFGQVVLVRFPFTDQKGRKQRPAVVISSSAYNRARADVIMMAITSQVRARVGFAAEPIENWQAAGLLKASLIKPVIFTAEKSIIRKMLGVLDQKDQMNLRVVIEAAIG